MSWPQTLNDIFTFKLTAIWAERQILNDYLWSIVTDISAIPSDNSLYIFGHWK